MYFVREREREEEREGKKGNETAKPMHPNSVFKRAHLVREGPPLERLLRGSHVHERVLEERRGPVPDAARLPKRRVRVVPEKATGAERRRHGVEACGDVDRGVDRHVRRVLGHPDLRRKRGRNTRGLGSEIEGKRKTGV
jgi:hypothetical protein